MKFSAIILSILAQLVTANKKSKAGSAMEEMTSCPNLSKRSGGGKRSKGGFAAGTADCGSGSTTTVNCGDSFHDKNIFLLKDLVCDGEEQTITLSGDSVLDCGGRTIIGDGEAEDSDDNILELRDNASVINCNFVQGYQAIATSGDGCITIQDVSVYDSDNDGIRIENSGTVVIREVSVYSAGDDGIQVAVQDGDNLRAIFENVRLLSSCYGFYFNGSEGDVVAEFYGNIFAWDSLGIESDLFYLADSDTNTDATIYGNLFVSESYYDGIYLGYDNTLTFAAGSFSEICNNGDVDYDDIYVFPDGDVFKEDGAVVMCDKENTDKNLCTPCEVDEALACIE